MKLFIETSPIPPGSEGVNHGVELRQDVIKYARARFEEFKTRNDCNEFNFAEPVFVHGECYLQAYHLCSLPLMNNQSAHWDYSFFFLAPQCSSQQCSKCYYSIIV